MAGSVFAFNARVSGGRTAPAKCSCVSFCNKGLNGDVFPAESHTEVRDVVGSTQARTYRSRKRARVGSSRRSVEASALKTAVAPMTFALDSGLEVTCEIATSNAVGTDSNSRAKQWFAFVRARAGNARPASPSTT